MLLAVYNCSRLDFSAGCCDSLLWVAVLLLAAVTLLLLAAMVVDVALVSAVVAIVVVVVVKHVELELLVILFSCFHVRYEQLLSFYSTSPCQLPLMAAVYGTGDREPC